jgi:3',5'-cyclic AMP phosphodiesterase CpdA
VAASGRSRLLFVHFGEEHWNDDDSDLTLPKVVADSARYRPDLVTTSGDKANDGTVDQLARWKEIMSRYDRAGVPYLAGIGNHDRESPPGVLPGTAGLLTPDVQGSLSNSALREDDRYSVAARVAGAKAPVVVNCPAGSERGDHG